MFITKKKFLIILIFLFTVFSFSLFIFKFNASTQFSDDLVKLFPIEFRAFIKNNINNAIPKSFEFQISYKDTELFYDNESIVKKFNESDILNLNTSKIFQMSFENLYNHRPEPFFIDSLSETQLLIASTSGDFYLLDILNNKNQKKIKSNFREFYNYTNNLLRIRDILINKNKIYISYIKEIKKNCYNVSMLIAPLNIKTEFVNLKFSEFFTHNQCISNQTLQKFNSPLDRNSIWPIKGHRSVVINQSGGALAIDENGYLYLSSGVFGARTVAQINESNFGKIIKISTDNGSYKIYSSGHRNPQGLYYNNFLEILMSSEHGPNGGDEVNKISNGLNYGWPISSYGFHYNAKDRPEAPLLKNHSEYGFSEPIYVFERGTAPSSIALIGKIKNEFYYIVSSLKGKKIFLFSQNNNTHAIKLIDEFYINERIRDIKVLENKILLTLETSKRILLLNYNLIK